MSFTRNILCPICGHKNDSCRISNTTGLIHCHPARNGSTVYGYTYLGLDKTGALGMYSPDNNRTFTPRDRSDDVPHYSGMTKEQREDLKRREYEAAKERWDHVGEASPIAEANRKDPIGELADNLRIPRGFANYMDWFVGGDWYGALYWSCPEWGIVDGKLTIVGRHMRFQYEKRGKITIGNPDLPEGTSKRGAFIPRWWLDPDESAPPVVYLPEGASDTTALAWMNLPAVGRANNTDIGVDVAARLIDGLDPERRKKTKIIVLGENDKKADGTWPGRDGGLLAARRLSTLLGCTVYLAFLPDGVKDVREWVKIHTTKGALGSQNTRTELGCYFWFDLQTRGEFIVIDHEEELRKAAEQAQQHREWAEWTKADIARLQAEKRERSAEAAARIRQARADQDTFPCHNVRPLVLSHNASGDPLIVGCRCENPSRCRGCLDYLRLRECENIALRVGGHEGQLYEGYVNEDQWHAWCMRKLRAGGGQHYAMPEMVDGVLMLYVIATVRVGCMIPVSAEQAVSTMQSIVNEIDDPRIAKRSREWHLPREEPSGEYSRIGIAKPLTPTIINEIAQTVEATVNTRTAEEPCRARTLWFTRLTRRAGWDSVSLAHVTMQLLIGETIPDIDVIERPLDGIDGLTDNPFLDEVLTE